MSVAQVQISDFTEHRGMPEKYLWVNTLWWKVIQRATYDYVMYKKSKSVRLRKLSSEAEQWLFGPSKDMSFGFEYMCDLLGFPITKIRAWAKSLRIEDIKRMEHVRREDFRPIEDSSDGEDI